MHLTRRIGQIGVCALVASAAAAAGITSASGESSARAVAHRSPSSPRTATVPRQLHSAYAVFRHAATGSGRPPRSAAFRGIARYAGSPGGSPVWLVAGNSQSCIVLASGGGACAPNAVVAHTGVVVGLVPTSGAGTTVVGIVPDGAHVAGEAAGGSRRPVGLSGNAFEVQSASHIVSFTVRGPRGAQQTTDMPAPAPPSRPSVSGSSSAVRGGSAPAGGSAAQSTASGPGGLG